MLLKIILETGSTRLEQEDGHLPHVEVDEVLRLVGHVGTEVSADYTMPGGVVLLVELFLDVCCDVLLDVELLEGYIGAVDGILLHLLVHVCVFDDGFSFSC